MLNINHKSQFTDKLINKLLEKDSVFLSLKEFKIYILYLLLEDGQFVNDEEDVDFNEV